MAARTGGRDGGVLGAGHFEIEAGVGDGSAGAGAVGASDDAFLFEFLFVCHSGFIVAAGLWLEGEVWMAGG